MKKQIVSSMAIAAVMMIFVGAEIDSRSAQLIRSGNDAFHRAEFIEALRFYQQTEERITDPGLAAFNKAVAFYRLEEYREAELHFRRSVEQAKPKRRAKSYYGLGSALLMQGKDVDAAALGQAIAAFRLCRRDAGADKGLRAKAAHNLELARLLLLKALKNNPQQSPPNNGENGNGNKNGKKPGNGNGDPTKHGQNPSNGKGKNKGKLGGKTGVKSVRIPGAGRLPTIPDDEVLQALSPEDVRRLLQNAVERIQRQKQQDWRAQEPASAPVKDW